MPKCNKQRGPGLWDILDNPAVSAYTGEIRKLDRPVINARATILFVLLNILVTGLFSSALSYGICFVAQAPLRWPNVFAICALACYGILFLLRLRRMLIFLVMLYQAKASEEIRLRCTFTPSCSEYMILSLKKYGVIIGLIKGTKRLSRCRNSFGYGYEDYP